MKPAMCGETELKLPDVNCDCDDLKDRVKDLEDRADVTDDRLDTLEDCCDGVQDTLEDHSTSITNINGDIIEINERIDNLSGLRTVKVDALPTVGEPNTMYLVQNGDSSVLWMYIDGQWESVGETTIDMSMYATVEQVNRKMDNPSIGDVLITSTNNRPSAPGSWTRVSKEFANTTLTNQGVSWNSTNTSSQSSAIVRKGKSVQIRLDWNSKVFMDDDDTKTICTIPFSSLGLSAIYNTHPLGFSDGDNCVGMFAFTSDNNRVVVTKVDTLHKGGEYKGNTWELDINVMFSEAQMLDASCDKFYWKRTA